VLTGAEQDAKHCSSDCFHLELSVSAKKKHAHITQQIDFYSIIMASKRLKKKEKSAIIILPLEHFICITVA